jgi:NAD+ synthase (glutamine-hydrolysing)
MKIVLAQLDPTVGELKGNTEKILNSIEKAKLAHADIVLFSEMCLSGYPPEDLLMLPQFIHAVQEHLFTIIPATKGITAIVGLPRMNPHSKEKVLYNSAAVIQDGILLGYHDKILLPTYDVFDERRYFEPGPDTKLWFIGGKKVGITICEDIWQHSDTLRFTSYVRDPVDELGALKPDIVVNLSSSPYSIDKPLRRIDVGRKAVLTMGCPLVLCNQVGGNDSLIFDGYSYYLNEAGELLQLAKGFQEDYMFVDTEKKLSPVEYRNDSVGDLYKALVLGLRDYMHKSGFKKACIGLSGGIDSAVVACIAVEALGAENVMGISMPSRYSSEHSKSDAEELAKNLGMQYSTVPIEEPFTSFLELLTPHFENKPLDITEENLQARIRGNILMAMSNKFGCMQWDMRPYTEICVGDYQ